MKNKTFYITTPIYYVNDVPHLGHSYTSLISDTIARYKKLSNFDVFFATGTDEHGQKVENSSKEKKIETLEFTNKVSERFKELTNKLKLTNNDFIRTTEARHKKTVRTVWENLFDKGEIYLGNYEGWYSIRDECFINESEINIDKNNNRIGPSKDILKKVKEPSYFFKLSKWQKPLLMFYEENKQFVQPSSRYKEVKKFVESGLEDLSISRTTFKWGINVPNDPKHVVYVWLDALFNYISILDSEEKKKKYWPADLHLVGKDILRFHAIFWPAFLLAAGFENPKQIYAHGWWTISGEKMSKSLGNVIDPNYLIDTYGLDQVRYFLLKEIPFGEDGNFSEDLLINRINSELSNDYGNLVQRVLSMLQKYKDGKIPSMTYPDKNDSLLIDMPNFIFEKIQVNMENYQFNLVLEDIWKIIRTCNGYVDKSQPWTLFRDKDFIKLDNVLYILINSIYKIAILLQPFLPESSKKIFTLLKQKSEIKFFELSKNIKEGIILDKPHAIFPRFTKAQ